MIIDSSLIFTFFFSTVNYCFYIILLFAEEKLLKFLAHVLWQLILILLFLFLVNWSLFFYALGLLFDY